MFSINLNRESAAVLLRCLNCGGSAISEDEVQTGVAKVMDDNIKFIRKQVDRPLAQEIIKEAAKRKGEEN